MLIINGYLRLLKEQSVCQGALLKLQNLFVSNAAFAGAFHQADIFCERAPGGF